MAKVFDIDQLINNPNAILRIMFGSFLVESYVVEDLLISGQAEHNERLAPGNIRQKINSVLDYLANVAGTPAIKFEWLDHSKLTWAASVRPVFVVPLMLVALRPNVDVRNDVAKLFRTIYPSQETGHQVLRPPLGYNPGGLFGRPSGTITVAIGQWFRAPYQVMKSVDFTLSKETTRHGFPLYAKGSITFTPYRLTTAEDIYDYFYRRDDTTRLGW